MQHLNEPNALRRVEQVHASFESDYTKVGVQRSKLTARIREWSQCAVMMNSSHIGHYRTPSTLTKPFVICKIQQTKFENKIHIINSIQ